MMVVCPLMFSRVSGFDDPKRIVLRAYKSPLLMGALHSWQV